MICIDFNVKIKNFAIFENRVMQVFYLQTSLCKATCFRGICTQKLFFALVRNVVLRKGVESDRAYFKSSHSRI